MNSRLSCTDCGNPIPNGTAVIRSRSLEQRAWHRECFALSHPDAGAIERTERAIAAQRTGAHDALDNARVS